MTLFESVHAVAGADDDGVIDWDAVADAAKAMTDPGDVDLSTQDANAYATDVRSARARIRDVSGNSFDVPETIEVQNRHHWVDANVETFRRVFAPLDRKSSLLEGVSRTVNTATTAGAIAFITRHVLGQYDPRLLSESDHCLYFVHPNIVRVAEKLDVAFPRFRRWIAFHEVTHAAEFEAAPWLADYLGTRIEDGVTAISEGNVTRESFTEVNVAMTAVEGYAELLMDEAFDDEYDDLRAKLDARRHGGDPITRILRRVLGFKLKREQYERGRKFFEHVAAERDISGASRVWEQPEFLPTEAEIETPARWLKRVPEQ